MANNIFQVKRTSVSGRTPNTTGSYATNTQYISAGEFALNMADGILYSSNGSAVIEVGANNTNVNISGNLTVKGVIANGSLGTANQVLTTNGTSTYWSTVTSGGSSNTSILANRVYQSFTATDGQNVFTVSGGYTINAIDVFYNGVHLSNTEYTQDGSTINLVSSANGGAIVEVSGFNTGVTSGGNTNVFYNNSGVVGSNANFTFDSTTTNLTVGNSSVNTQITPGNVYLNGSTLVVGNTSTNVTVNSTALSFAGVSVNSTVYPGTANNTSYVGSVTAANVVSNAQLQSNLANYAALSGASFTGDITTTGNVTANNISVNYDLNVTRNAVITGNLQVYGTTLTVSTANFRTSDNLLYLNEPDSATVTNASGNGSTITYTANNNYYVGGVVSVTGITPSGFNTTGYVSVTAANSTTFQVSNTFTGAYTSGGTASFKAAINPDMGFAGGYNDGTYHHAGFIRDASDGIWKVFEGYTPEPDASINIDTTNTSFQTAAFQAATLYGGNTSTNWFIANNSGVYSANAYVNNITANTKIIVGNAVSFNFGTLTIVEGAGNSNSYMEFNNQNISTGNNASSDFVATADTGNDAVNFIDLGINGSGYNQPTFNIIGALDGYLYTSNGSLAIGTASNKELIFHANGTTSTDRKLTVNATSITIANTVALVANGTNGTSGQVLTSNGSATYWSTPSSGGTALGLVTATALGFNLP